jgi:signal transduction histidine kinase
VFLVRFPGPSGGSIALRLFVSAAVLSFFILFIAGVTLSTIYRSTAEAGFDERLGVYLRALVADIATPSDESRTEAGQLGDPQFELALSGWYWQITKLNTPQPEIKGSRSLFAAKLPRLESQGVPAGIGGSRRGYVKGPDDRELRMVERIIDAGDQGVFLIQVAATTEELESQMAHFQLNLFLTFLVLAFVLVGSSAVQLRFGLRPLRRLQEGVAAIRRGEGEKIEGTYPRDLAPLASEINLLIAANRQVVERSRTQVGNLAHALKTPLSVIINEDASDERSFAKKVREQAALMRDQIAYYLNRAQLAVRVAVSGDSTEIEPVIDALVRTFEKIYRDRMLLFETKIPSGVRFLGERQDFEEMIGNLVDNAGKWADHAIVIEVVPAPLSDVGDRAYFNVIIDDDGAGLTADHRETALRRGLRLDESKPGSGLGLSIVVDLASLYGGALKLGMSPLGGLRAELRLPAA